MARQSLVPKKKRGPPATGHGIQIQVRIQPGRLAVLDAWIQRQEDRPSRPEAIRRLFELGLSVDKVARRGVAKETSRKASDLAAREVERVRDPSHPPEDHARRKRALIHGPKEFRDIRADQPKKKV